MTETDDRKHWKRVGGQLVATDKQRAALDFMEPTLGVAHKHADRLDRLLPLIAQAAAAGAEAITKYNEDPHVRGALSQLDQLSGSPIRRGSDLRYLVLQRLARLLGCSDTAALEQHRPWNSQDIAHAVDISRGLAMNSLAEVRTAAVPPVRYITRWEDTEAGKRAGGHYQHPGTPPEGPKAA